MGVTESILNQERERKREQSLGSMRVLIHETARQLKTRIPKLRFRDDVSVSKTENATEQPGQKST